ncbi:DUF5819 family protein [Streptomyces sp. NPDC050560]|uniref:DUF5819 family protein n=1 Tax=Streptomyces sp. NPDC050560 TaxID=3365630 RepID=UPI003793A679
MDSYGGSAEGARDAGAAAEDTGDTAGTAGTAPGADKLPGAEGAPETPEAPEAHGAHGAGEAPGTGARAVGRPPGPRSPGPPPDDTSDTSGTDPADPADGTGAAEAPDAADTDPSDPRTPPDPPPDPPRGIEGLSFRYRMVAVLALTVVTVGVLVHLALVFLHVAPSNTLTQQHGDLVGNWIYPEFEQNWKLFAPDPLQQNIHVQVRTVRASDAGDRTTSGWYDLTAQDAADIDHNPLPSHVTQNELRRAWEFFTSSHDSDNRPVGSRGRLSEQYLRRILVMRLSRIGDTADDADDGDTGAGSAKGAGGVIERVQVRSMTTNVQMPDWTGKQVDTKPRYRTLPWWDVGPADVPLGGENVVRTPAEAR